MNILVTGARGFVGRNLVSQLHNIQNGKAKNYAVSGEILSVFEYDVDSDPAELEIYCRQADFVLTWQMLTVQRADGIHGRELRFCFHTARYIEEI